MPISNITLEVLVTATRQEKQIKVIEVGKEERNFFYLKKKLPLDNDVNVLKNLRNIHTYS